MSTVVVVRQMLHRLLVRKTCQYPMLLPHRLGKVLRTYLDHNTAVGVGGVAKCIRHAVHHQLTVRCGRRHYLTAGTHTEGIDTATARLGNKTVTRRWQITSALLPVVLDGVNECLWMLHADSHRKTLALKDVTRTRQEMIHISG